MVVDRSLLASLTEEQKERMRVQDVVQDILRNVHGGGNGGGSGLDARVARLEGRIDKIGDDLGTVKVDIATIKENVRHLPTKDFIVTALTATLTVIAAIAVFLDKIRVALGLAG